MKITFIDVNIKAHFYERNNLYTEICIIIIDYTFFIVTNVLFINKVLLYQLLLLLSIIIIMN